MAKAKAKKPAQPTLRVGKPRRHRLQVPPRRRRDGGPAARAPDAGHGRPPVLARRLRPERRGPRERGPASSSPRPSTGCSTRRRARWSAPSRRATASRSTRSATRAATPTWCCSGSTAWCGRRPARRAPDVLLAPALGELPHGGQPAAAAREAERPVPHVRRPRRANTATRLPRPGARGHRRTRRCCATSTARRTSAAARTRTTPASSWSSSRSASSTPRASRTTPRTTSRTLAKALSGWRIDDTDPNNATSRFDSPLVLRLKILSCGTRGNYEDARRREQRAGPPGPRARTSSTGCGPSSSSARRTRRRWPT